MKDVNMFNKRDILRLSIPIMIDQISALLMGIIDSAMVSNCGEAVVSGVSIVDLLNYIIIVIFNAVASGGSVVIAQYIGKTDKENAAKASMHTLILGTVIAVACTLPCVLMTERMITMVYGTVDGEILKNAVSYFFFLALSNPFFAIYLSCSAAFRANGNTKPIMLVSVLINILNCIGNATLIYGFGLGAAGAAISTSVCRLIGASLILFLLFKQSNIISIRGKELFKMDFAMIKRITNVSIPTGVETLLFQLGGLVSRRFLVAIPNSVIELAANAVANSLFNVTNIVGLTLSTAIMPVVGQCIGADRKLEAKKHTVDFVIISSLLNAVVSIVIFAFLDGIISVYGIGAEATAIAKRMLTLNCLFVPLMWGAAAIFPGAFRAAGDNKFVMIVSMSLMWSIRVGLAYVFVTVFNFGAIGVWYAMYIEWVFKVLIYSLRYRSGRWLEKKVI